MQMFSEQQKIARLNIRREERRTFENLLVNRNHLAAVMRMKAFFWGASGVSVFSVNPHWIVCRTKKKKILTEYGWSCAFLSVCSR